MYKELDDCLLGFIDCVAVKRFFTKCGISVEEAVIVAIIRRLDLNADAKLSRDEFRDAISPIEEKKPIAVTTKTKRPSTAKSSLFEPSKMP